MKKEAIILTETTDLGKVPAPASLANGTKLFDWVVVGTVVRKIPIENGRFAYTTDVGSMTAQLLTDLGNAEVGDHIIIDLRYRHVCTAEDLADLYAKFTA